MYSVKDILDEKGYECFTIEPSATVFEALEMMTNKDVGALLIVEEDKVLGVFSERDYARKVVLKGKSSKETNVSEMMSGWVYPVNLNTRTKECMRIMTDNHVRHLPVIENDKLVGIVSIGDIVNTIIEDKNNLIEQLENYITGKG